MKNYKIGEFSKYLGVTPDFIKYYEKEGLIKPIPGSSPKLYPFNQSSKILECIKLKNLGFSVKEMYKYLFEDNNKDYHEAKEKLNYEQKKILALNKELEEYENWLNTYENDPQPYSLENTPSFYFLKHSNDTDFVHDEKIYEILNDWTKLMPMVKPTVHVTIKDGKVVQRIWGMSISEENAKNLNVPINEACTLVQKQKALFYNLMNQEANRETELEIYSTVLKKAQKCGLKLSGEIYAQILSGTAYKRSARNMFLLEQ